ncbi:MAG: 4Fe-4S dicluster domain-containing protein [Nitrososphaerota archaeon]|nr:4Fe-4S dicluster domain-containing protein [Nitrososphaerota archaeon]
MNPERRKFLTGASVAAVGLTVGALSGDIFRGTSAQTSGSPSDASKKSYIFVIDLNNCDGCQKCTEACQAEMDVPPASGGELQFDGRQAWIQVFSMGSGVFMPVPCQNCQDAPCAKVCPVGATFYSDDHIVQIDQNRCVGCRYCLVACPYQRRFFNWFDPPVTPDEANAVYSPDTNIPHRKGVAEKCIWCRHRVVQDEVPACVAACGAAGMNALWFGDAAENVVSNGKTSVSLSGMVKDRGAYRLNEELGTLPQVIYLPPKGD